MTYKPPRSVHVFFQFAFHDACVLGPGPRFEACAYMPDKFRCLCKISRSSNAKRVDDNEEGVKKGLLGLQSAFCSGLNYLHSR